MPSPNLIASALARRTSDTALCVMGNSLALYNPPTRVAEEFAMIDCYPVGRLIAGFPVGSPMDTCYAYGQNPSTLRERYLEAHDLIVRAWTDKDTFAFNGRYNQQRYVNIWPRPVQDPRPPIWVPGGGSIETWRWCAEMDYVYCYLSYFGYKIGQATMDGFLERNVHGSARIAIQTERDSCNSWAWAKAASTRWICMDRLPNTSTATACTSTHASPRRRDTRRRRPSGSGLQSQVSKAAEYTNKFNTLAREMDAIVENGYVIVGSPDEVAEQLREVATNLNVGNLMMLLQFGNMNKELHPL